MEAISSSVSFALLELVGNLFALLKPLGLLASVSRQAVGRFDRLAVALLDVPHDLAGTVIETQATERAVVGRFAQISLAHNVSIPQC